MSNVNLFDIIVNILTNSHLNLIHTIIIFTSHILTNLKQTCLLNNETPYTNLIITCAWLHSLVTLWTTVMSLAMPGGIAHKQKRSMPKRFSKSTAKQQHLTPYTLAVNNETFIWWWLYSSILNLLTGKFFLKFMTNIQQFLSFGSWAKIPSAKDYKTLMTCYWWGIQLDMAPLKLSCWIWDLSHYSLLELKENIR